MAGGKVTPRQKMINMMYLVLTALLALNVSKEILNAFVIMDDGLTESRLNVENKNAFILKQFQNAAKDQPKFQENFEKAQKIHKMADALYADIEKMKIDLIKEADGPETEAVKDGKIFLAKLAKKDDYDTPTRVMCGLETGPPGKGAELKNKLKKYVNDLLAFVPKDKQEAQRKAYSIDPKDEKDPEEPELDTWEEKIFHHTPMAAAIAHLSKIQGDVRNAESEAVAFQFKEVTANQISFDTFAAIANIKDGFIFTGSSTEMTIGLGAYDSSQKLKIVLNGSQVSEDKFKNGVAVIPINGGSVGEQTMKGEVFVFDPKQNKEVGYPFETKYVVGAPMATISATKMNVMYIGVDNPIDISVSGVSASNIQPSFPGCTVTGSAGHYQVKPPAKAGSKVMVSVGAKLPNGTSKQMGSMEFRVKDVPNPVIMCMNKTGGKIPRGQIAAAPGLNSIMQNFDFQLQIPVVSYEISGLGKNGLIAPKTCYGPAFGADAKSVINAVTTNGKLFIENIKVKTPTGNKTLDQNLVFTITN